ncbi:RloB family protein [Mogibacterium pumilum]|uniref:RloB family protein n=1 Tax=Mogibacterium pumilum TaxID=86332 RepID=UPI001F19B6D3|nr:RloB family protein [Mogibacterium pumilum]
MGSDDIFKKRKGKVRKKRRREFLKPRVNSFLIVTEGEKTEPLYLNGIKKLITEK